MKTYIWKVVYPDGDIEYLDYTVEDFVDALMRLQKNYVEKIQFDLEAEYIKWLN